MRTGELRALTSLRGIAAMAVVLQHFSSTAAQHCAGWMPSLAPHGYMAVDFFFVLSGFIMCYTYLDDFQARGARAYTPFLVKRVARIVPLSLVMLAVILAAGAVASWWGRSDLFINQPAASRGLAAAVALNALLLQGFFNSYNLNDPSWSISVEMAAYLLFPILAVLVFRSRIGCIAYALAGVALLAGLASSRPRLGLDVGGDAINLGRCVAEFGFGMMAFALFRRGGALRALGRDGWTIAVSALAVGMLVLRIDLLAALCFPVVVLAWAWNDGRASRLMSCRPLRLLGAVSFSLYLVHHMFRAPELEALRWLSPDPVSPILACAFALAGAVSVLPAAVAAHYAVERPGRRVIRSAAEMMQRGGQALARVGPMRPAVE